jgi:DUF3102 family protein
MQDNQIARTNEYSQSLIGDSFDYNSVSPSVAKFLVGQADRIRQHCAMSAVQIGNALLEAKRHLSHGGFLQWVQCEVGIPARTAQAYMRVASWVSGKSATVARLSPTILYLLSSTGTPEDFVNDVLRRATAGEVLLPSAVRKELKSFRLNKQQHRFRVELAACETRQDELKWETGRNVSGIGKAVVELVDILARGLSASDFARVQELMTCHVMLSDPQLTKNFENAFERASTMMQILA